jgi:arylsulfatase A-like enzyme
LHEAGLATGGMVHDCVWLNPKFGFHRGFEDYRSVKWRTGQITRAAVNWMAAHRDRPFFFFLHTFDPHSDFRHLPYEGAGVDTASVRTRFAVDGYGCRDRRCASDLLGGLGNGEIEPLPGEKAILEYLYAAGVRETDAQLGRLFDDLHRLGLWDELTIVVTSDHGEMLLEHGRTLHGQWWNEVLQVPLIVKWAHGERAGRRTTVPTSALDLAPTLLDLAGAAADDLPGSDLRRPRQDRPIFSLHADWWVVFRGGFKGAFGLRGRHGLYDLTADPREEHDLTAERPALAAELEEEVRALHRWSAATRDSLGQGGTAGSRVLTDEERDRLRALGYLQ